MTFPFRNDSICLHTSASVKMYISEVNFTKKKKNKINERRKSEATLLRFYLREIFQDNVNRHTVYIATSGEYSFRIFEFTDISFLDTRAHFLIYELFLERHSAESSPRSFVATI